MRDRILRAEENRRYFGYKRQLGFVYACFFLTENERALIRGMLASGRRDNLFGFLAKALARAQEEDSRAKLEQGAGSAQTPN